MEELKFITAILSISNILSAIIVIINFVSRLKKPVDKAVDKKIQEVLEPINAKLTTIDSRIDKLDKNECKNYLTEFLEDVKNGVPKSDIQIQRATEVYDHYINDLHLNTYIHDGWEKYMN